jgi:hypothetical protein
MCGSHTAPLPCVYLLAITVSKACLVLLGPCFFFPRQLLHPAAKLTGLPFATLFLSSIYPRLTATLEKACPTRTRSRLGSRSTTATRILASDSVRHGQTEVGTHRSTRRPLRTCAHAGVYVTEPGEETYNAVTWALEVRVALSLPPTSTPCSGRNTLCGKGSGVRDW